MPPRRRSTDGFSIMEMSDDIKDAAGNLLKALASQGVDASEDQLYLGIQNLVGQVAMANGSNLMASEGAAVKYMPYSATADFLVTAFEHFCNDDKRTAVRLVVQAFDQDDADTLMHGLLVMNNNSETVKKLEAAEAAATGNGSGDGSGEDGEGELSDDELDELIESDQANGGDDGGESEELPEDGEGEGDGGAAPTVPTKSPMNPDAPAKPVTASIPLDRAQRILAIKLSSSGDPADRRKAEKLMGR